MKQVSQKYFIVDKRIFENKSKKKKQECLLKQIPFRIINLIIKSKHAEWYRLALSCRQTTICSTWAIVPYKCTIYNTITVPCKNIKFQDET